MVDTEDHRFVINECLKEARRCLSVREDIPDTLYVFFFASVSGRRFSTPVRLNSPLFNEENGMRISRATELMLQVLDAKSAIHADLTDSMGAPPKIVALCRRDKLYLLRDKLFWFDPSPPPRPELAGGDPGPDTFGVVTRSTDAHLVTLAPIVDDRAGLGRAQIYLVMENDFKVLEPL